MSAWFTKSQKKIKPKTKQQPAKPRIFDRWWLENWLSLIKNHSRPQDFELAELVVAQRRPYLVIEPGIVSTSINGSFYKSQNVNIRCQPFPDEVWHDIAKAFSKKLSHITNLLTGDFPKDLEDPLDQHGLSWFPLLDNMFEVYCDCSARGEFCPHVTALCLELGNQINQDPFVLFQLYGKSRSDFMALLNEAKQRAKDLPATVISPSAIQPPQNSCKDCTTDSAQTGLSRLASFLNEDNPTEVTATEFWGKLVKIDDISDLGSIEIPPPNTTLLHTLGKPPFSGNPAKFIQNWSEFYNSTAKKCQQRLLSCWPEDSKAAKN